MTVRRYAVVMKHADLHVVEADLAKVRKERGDYRLIGNGWKCGKSVDARDGGERERQGGNEGERDMQHE